MSTPKPITRQDKYYNYLINGSGELPEPVTRKDKYLHYLCANGFSGGGTVTPEQIRSAVNAYLQENPVNTGATAEQVEQINENTQAIEELKETSIITDDFPSYDDVFNLLNESEGA